MVTAIRTVDVAAAAAAFVLLGGLSLMSRPGDTMLVALAVVALSVPLLFRSVAPVTSAVWIYGASLAQAIVLGIPLPMNVVVLFALYSVTVHGPRWASILGVIGGFIGAGMFATMLIPSWTEGWIAVFVATGFAVIVAAALGFARRSRKERVDALRAREEALERSRFRDAELAVAAERARIAREMHDVVAHSLAVIIAQADGGRYAAKADPAQGIRSLETISDIGRAALADIRRILGVLRSDDGDGPIVRPQPTDDDLAQVVEQVRATGAAVAFTTIGRPRPLMPGMGLTLQRICQEALTNSLKHAGPGAKMAVLLQFEEHQVSLQIDDDGRGAAAVSDGNGTGIVGMRERAALFGGTLQAGPRPTGGYRVKLVLPLPVQEPKESA